MREFDYSFLKKDYLPPEILLYVSDIESSEASSVRLKSESSEIFTVLEKIARVQSVKGSNEIEGIVTTDDRIHSIVAGITAPANHSEEEIAGYRDALDQIHENYNLIDFDEESIKMLHQIIMQRSLSDEAGEYKHENNFITEISPDGSSRVRYSPPPADETAELMAGLAAAYQAAICDKMINRLLLIPCVILDFLCIHPFSDGNGRVSRLLSLLLLYKNGYNAGRYISFEQMINSTRSEYYLALQKSSNGWQSDRCDYLPFIIYYLKTLSACYSELNSRLPVAEDIGLTKAARIELTLRRSTSPVSKADICALLPDVSPTTVEATLGKLLKAGAIRKTGRGRSTKYEYL